MDREAELRAFVTARGAALSRAAFLLTGDHPAAEDLGAGHVRGSGPALAEVGHGGPRGLDTRLGRTATGRIRGGLPRCRPGVLRLETRGPHPLVGEGCSRDDVPLEPGALVA